MKSNESSKSLIVMMKNAYPKLRQVLVYALVVSLGLSSVIQSPMYKVSVVSALAVTLLFLLFDIYHSVNEKLIEITSCVQLPLPPQYGDFAAASEHIYEEIESALAEKQKIELQFLTVSGSYSWPFFEDLIRRLESRTGRDKRIEATFFLVRPMHFDAWNLMAWKAKSKATIERIEEFNRRLATLVRGRSIQVSVQMALFDNMPHWHGVLIDGSTLFMGRTEWEFEESAPDLLVGQIEYRKFQKGDRFGGDQRIERFKNWVRRYQLRSKELGVS